MTMTERKTRAAGCVRPAAAKTNSLLAFHKRRHAAFRQLPFVGKSAWDVPATGGFYGGCQTGEALALLFLKHLRQHGGNDHLPLDLLVIARDMALRVEQEGGQAMFDRPLSKRSASLTTLNGQMVGFFSELSRLLLAAAKRMGASLDGISDEALLAKANAGLAADEGGSP